MTAPHFFASDFGTLELNVELVKLTAHEYGSDFEVRAVCSVFRPLLAEPNRARTVVRLYAESGVSSVELRLSPLGKSDEGVQKIKSTFDILRAFREYDISVILGFQGVIGETAYAAGLIDGYSTGIGLNDRFDFAAVKSSQKQNAQERSGGGDRRPRGRGAPRVLLPTAGVQVSKKVAETLFADRAIRARLACRLGDCANSIDGPLRFPLRHYLHDRAHTISEIDRLPRGWRAAQQRDRLQRSIELCEVINSHLDDASGVKKLETRTLESLRVSLDQLLQRSSTA